LKKSIKIKSLRIFSLKKILILSLIIILYGLLMLLPRDWLIKVPGGDNFGHIYIDCIISILIFYILRDKNIYFKLFFIFSLTTLVELAQILTSRNFSISDIFYNSIGILVGITVYYLFIFILKRKKILISLLICNCFIWCNKFMTKNICYRFIGNHTFVYI